MWISFLFSIDSNYYLVSSSRTPKLLAYLFKVTDVSIEFLVKNIIENNLKNKHFTHIRKKGKNSITDKQVFTFHQSK